MKAKNKLKWLEARIKNWESIPKSVQGGYTKPGSQSK